MCSKNNRVATLMFEAVQLGFICGVLELRKAWAFFHLVKRCILVKTKIQSIWFRFVLDFVSVWCRRVWFSYLIGLVEGRTTGVSLCVCTGRSSDKLSHPGSVQAGALKTVIFSITTFHILKSNLQNKQQLGHVSYFIRYMRPHRIIFTRPCTDLSYICFCVFIE